MKNVDNWIGFFMGVVIAVLITLAIVDIKSQQPHFQHEVGYTQPVCIWVDTALRCVTGEEIAKTMMGAQ